jgi:hypothetical protein
MVSSSHAKHRRRSALGIAAAVILAVIAVTLIVVPNLPSHDRSSGSNPVRSEISTIDPAALVPRLADLPLGSSVQSNAYITTAQASQRNQTSLNFLRGAGREIGFDRDFRVPRYGDIDVEVVRFKSHAGMSRAYDYFLRLPGAQGLNAVPFSGVGEHAALVTSSQAGFVEFMRGRYYAVITTVPTTQSTLRYVHALARRLDTRILHYGPSA